MTQTFQLETDYVQLFPDGSAERHHVDAGFWSAIEQRTALHAGRLLGSFSLEVGAGDHFEMHPAGDELLVLISGRAKLVLHDPTPREVEMTRARACIVPRGVWHRVDVLERGELIFITPGEGTEHSDQPRTSGSAARRKAEPAQHRRRQRR